MATINHLEQPAAFTNTAESAKQSQLLYDHQLLTHTNDISILFSAAASHTMEVDKQTARQLDR